MADTVDSATEIALGVEVAVVCCAGLDVVQPSTTHHSHLDSFF